MQAPQGWAGLVEKRALQRWLEFAQGACLCLCQWQAEHRRTQRSTRTTQVTQPREGDSNFRTRDWSCFNNMKKNKKPKQIRTIIHSKHIAVYFCLFVFSPAVETNCGLYSSIDHTHLNKSVYSKFRFQKLLAEKTRAHLNISYSFFF